MASEPSADVRLRRQQIFTLRRQWLRDQELSPREPATLPGTRPGPVAAAWARFLQPGTAWRLRTYRAAQSLSFGFRFVLVPAWIVHYYLKYHVATDVPYGHCRTKPRVYPGDTIVETGEVIPELNIPHADHHH
ncbi:NADH dehydrogenase [ubiquinone] 1 beta subcomplex subunit 6 [Lethenteron reissneri]|uniref:NADH dehydrogenase [ubiquinone] 1 beta subcomplex subunit 6 n=1 Tax=Lethenteron reissneri TaxID=7753 RepID=UPI002AB69597|nr:NADH dehydrogenase [ubiquinone] 1 beta subcomplex subunit 6 [Lethenteron reissneri]